MHSHVFVCAFDYLLLPSIRYGPTHVCCMNIWVVWAVWWRSIAEGLIWSILEYFRPLVVVGGSRLLLEHIGSCLLFIGAVSTCITPLFVSETSFVSISCFSCLKGLNCAFVLFKRNSWGLEVRGWAYDLILVLHIVHKSIERGLYS